MEKAKCCIHTVLKPQGVNVQNSVEIDSAVMNLRMREKNAFSCGFLVNISIYLSVYLSIPFYVGATGQIFEQFRRFMAQTTYVRNHWCLLGSQ